MPERLWAALTGAVVTSLFLVACGSGDEPAGLDGSAEPTTTPDAADTSDATPTADPDATSTSDDGGDGSTSDDDAQGRSFEQPFLQEKNVVTLRDEVPIEVPDDAGDVEADVVEAFGRYYAVTEQILWGVPIEDTDIESVAAGTRLESAKEYAQESLEQERVTVGPPVSVHVLSVAASGNTGALDVCIDASGSADVFGGDMPDPNDPLVRFEVELSQSEGDWLVTRSSLVEDLAPCKGVFE